MGGSVASERETVKVSDAKCFASPSVASLASLAGLDSHPRSGNLMSAESNVPDRSSFNKTRAACDECGWRV
jgi:hypothetical protein